MRSPLLYLGFSVVMVLFGALFGPMFIDWSNYRGDLERYAERITGRPVHIGGSVEIKILPTPMLRVGDVRIANAEGATSPDLLRAGHVEVRLSLTPLLQGKFQVKSLNFDKTVFELERLDHDKGNWQLHSSGRWKQIFSAENISLEEATVRDGIVFLRDKMRGGVARLDNVDLDISASSLAGPYRLNGSVRYQNQPLLLSVATGRRNADGDMQLSVNLVPEGASRPTYLFDGRMLGGDAEDILDGKLRIARNEKPTIGDGRRDERSEAVIPFSFTSKVKASFRRIRLEDISFYIDQAQSGGAVTGAMAVFLGDTIETSVALEARHLDFDRIAERIGVKPVDIIPGLDMIGAITQGVEILPRNFRARIKFDANALTIGGDTIETATLSAKYLDGALTVTDASGVLPGRSVLALDNLRFGSYGGISGFEGNIRLETRDTKGFMRWTLPSASAWLDALPNGFKGVSSLSGKIAVNERSIGIKQTNLQVDGMAISGSMSLAPGVRPSVAANLQIDELDIDRYVVPPASGAAPDATQGVLDEIFPGLGPAQLAGFDGNLVVRATKVRRWGRPGSEFTAAVDVRNGDLVIRELAVAGLFDMDLALDGRIGWIGGRPHGRLSARIDAKSPRKLLDIPGLRKLLPVSGEAADRALAGMAPARLRFDVESTENGAATRSTLNVSGFLGLNEISLNAGFAGDWSRPGAGAITVDGQMTNEDGGILALLTGEPPDASAATADPDTLRLHLSGVLDKGVEAALSADLKHARLMAKGNLAQTGESVSVTSNISLKATDVAPILRAFGLVRPDDASMQAAVELEGKLGGTLDKLAITGVKGSVGDVPATLDGTLDVSGDTPRFSGNLSVAKGDLPWALSRLLALPGPVVTAAGGRAADAQWPSVPFGAGPLSGIELELGLKVDELKVSERVTAHMASAQITARDDAVSISRMKAKLSGGDLALDLRMSGQGGRLQVEGQYRIDNASFAETFSGRLATSPMTGRYTIVGTAKGAGRSPAGLISSLNGSGSLSVEDGAVAGINPVPFSAALGDVSTAPELDGLIGTTLTDGEMTFSGFTSAFALSNGVVKFDEADIDGAGASGTVRGYVDLSMWHMDSEWTVGLKKYPDAPSFSLVLAGPLATPGRSYDVKELRSFFIVKGLTEGVQRLERLQREEQERLTRLQELEDQARRDKAKRDRERREQARLERERLDKERRALEAERERLELEALVRRTEEPADGVQTGSTDAAREAEQPVAVPAPGAAAPKEDAEKAARTKPGEEAVSEPPGATEEEPIAPRAPRQAAVPKPESQVQGPQRPNAARTVPSQTVIERRPLVEPPQTQFAPTVPQVPGTGDDITVQDIDALILQQIERQALDEPSAYGDPVDITPRNQPSRTQRDGSSDGSGDTLK
ncbi:MAG: AsmA family protein [Hyphomicrobiales bacterium]